MVKRSTWHIFWRSDGRKHQAAVYTYPWSDFFEVKYLGRSELRTRVSIKGKNKLPIPQFILIYRQDLVEPFRFVDKNRNDDPRHGITWYLRGLLGALDDQTDMTIHGPGTRPRPLGAAELAKLDFWSRDWACPHKARKSRVLGQEHCSWKRKILLLFLRIWPF